MIKTVEKYVRQAVSAIYNADEKKIQVNVEVTKKGIDGDYTVVVFPFVKLSKKSPEDTAKDIGVYLKGKFDDIASYNIIKGFLNVKLATETWIRVLNNTFAIDLNKKLNLFSGRIMIEFSSPNTNKPLHLGHVRNNLLGESISRILKYAGYDVVKVNLINDRGIHISKTILAWQKWGDGKTPKDIGIKGDKYVGSLYVRFETEYKNQVADLISKGMDEKSAEQSAELMIQAREILKKWESGDEQIIQIWKMMNNWVYEGFDYTYKKMGIDFDKYYYESETYLLGKEIVDKGLKSNVFFKEDDNSVWVDFEKKNLEKKLLLRSDGTTVYMTQDLGTAFQRFDDYDLDKILYIVGNEQNYHFTLLKEIVAKFDTLKSDRIEHLSYGMVELPDGKMKSREGKVVDADDLVDDMIKTASDISKEQGRINELPENEKQETIESIAMAALKYFILKVDPKKNMMFNPQESIDFSGNTGPFIQYTHARIISLLNKAEKQRIKFNGKASEEARLVDKEITIISNLLTYPDVIANAVNNLNPAVIANYLYDLVKEYNQYYHDYTILKEKDSKILQFRLILSQQVANTIKSGMHLLGIDVPDTM